MLTTAKTDASYYGGSDYQQTMRNNNALLQQERPNIWNMCITLLFGVERKKDSVKSFKRNDN